MNNTIFNHFWFLLLRFKNKLFEKSVLSKIKFECIIFQRNQGMVSNDDLITLL